MGEPDEDFAAKRVGLADCEAGFWVAEEGAGGGVDGDGDVGVVGLEALEEAVVADGGGGEGAWEGSVSYEVDVEKLRFTWVDMFLLTLSMHLS